MKVVLKFHASSLHKEKVILCKSIKEAKIRFMEEIENNKCKVASPAEEGPYATLMRQADYDKKPHGPPEWSLVLGPGKGINLNWLKEA